ncbi:NAD(P)/FAD-dependent oxidoreductase [Rhodococcus sp. X156]|uniref:flavin-containing monooxygenase n=1 Tax=Rhodococcus sp. X156 TaxID=2499145 RepID=UPI000FD8A32C|nr:NAD(P)/FAD-dependent oxidoreductase [Rhodococcus sp. X156]
MTSTAPAPQSVHDVLVVGAGFAGLYAVHRARQAGLDVLAVEAGTGVGGTWFWNRYPGARCDVESVDYSYSFDEDLQQSWIWSERYAGQPEILAYLEHVADRFDLRRDIVLGQRVTSAHLDEDTAVWHVGTDTGQTYLARFVLMATGCLSALNKPDIPGTDSFAGEVYFTAAWPQQEPDLTGKRVGIIGTGSSGVQSVPLLAERAASLTVFQRSANYSVPMPNHVLTPADQERIRAEYPARRKKSAYAPAGTPHESYPHNALELSEQERLAAMEARWAEGGVLFGKTFPDQNANLAANDVVREFAEAKIRSVVADPEVADALVPTDHPIGTKRICTDIGYYQTFNQPHVRLVNLRTDPIVEITPTGVVTEHDVHELDVLVYATGFDAMTGALLRIDIRGARGTTIADAWGAGPVTFLGMAIPGLPNLFNLSGPGSPSVLANMVLHAEAQVDWLVDLVASCRERGVATVEARREAAEEWTEHVDAVAQGTLFPQARSWYMGANIEGKKQMFMPYIGGFGTYRRACDEVAAKGYEGFTLSS